MKRLFGAALLAALFLVLVPPRAIAATPPQGTPVSLRNGVPYMSLSALLQDPALKAWPSRQEPDVTEINWMGMDFDVRLNDPAYRSWGDAAWTPLAGVWIDGYFWVRVDEVQAFFAKFGDGGGMVADGTFVLPDPDAAFARRFDLAWLQGLQPDESRQEETKTRLWHIYLEWRGLGIVPETAYPLKVRIVRDLSPYYGAPAPSNLAGAVPWTDPHTAYVRSVYANQIGILRHELFHTLWLDVTAPRWLNEGLARLFEKDLWASQDAAIPSPMKEPPTWSWYESASAELDSQLYEASQETAFSMEKAMGKDRFMRDIQKLIRHEITADGLVRDAQAMPVMPELPGGVRQAIRLAP